VVILFIILIFAGCMLAASWHDMTTMLIPNWISLVLVAGFFVITPFVWQGWEIFGTHVLIGVIFFAIGVGMFALGWMGGGDAKLLAATSIWWMWADLPYYLAYTAIAGGVLAIILVVGRKLLPDAVLATAWLRRLFKDEKKMPYGLALAFGALMTLPKSDLYQFALSLS